MKRMLLAQDLQPTAPLVGNEEAYAKAAGLSIVVIKKISKAIKKAGVA